MRCATQKTVGAWIANDLRSRVGSAVGQSAVKSVYLKSTERSRVILVWLVCGGDELLRISDRSALARWLDGVSSISGTTDQGVGAPLDDGFLLAEA